VGDRDPLTMTRQEIEDELYSLRQLIASIQRLHLRRPLSPVYRHRTSALQRALNALKVKK